MTRTRPRVTAFVRSPEKLPRDRPGLTVIQGSPGDVPALAQVMYAEAIGFDPMTIPQKAP